MNVKKTTLFCWAILLALSAVLSYVKAADECTFDSDCRYTFTTRYCCGQRYTWEDNVCKTSCIGESCSSSFDCADDECCDTDNECAYSCSSVDLDGLAGWVVAVIVISVIVVVVVPIAIVVFCCCCAAAASTRGTARGGVVVTQPATAGVAVVSTQQQQQQQYPAQPGQPMYYPPNQQYPNQAYPNQTYPNQPPPYQPYPTGGSGPEFAMTPNTEVKQ